MDEDQKARAGARAPDPDLIWQRYQQDLSFKSSINLFDTVEANENFYVGKQWEGVDSQGLPTPVLNVIKRIILYQVATTATDAVKMSARPLPMARRPRLRYPLEYICKVIGAQFDALWEINKMSQITRYMMKDAAVDGDACLYSYWDPDFETGQDAKGIVRTELIDNTRVGFGDPNERDPQKQPWMVIARRRLIQDMQDEARENGQDPDQITPDDDDTGDHFSVLTKGKATELLYLWRDKGTRTIHAVKTCKSGTIRPAWDMGLRLYPLVWLSWERVKNSYHGQAAVTGLIPNQLFVNKQAALEMVSAMNDAFQKPIFDKTRIPHWDGRIGRGIGVNGPVTDAWDVVPPAPNSGKGESIMKLVLDTTKEFNGATDAATGVGRPDNATAILAMQKASQVPTELTIQDRNQGLEDLGMVWCDFMRAFYGQRWVEAIGPEELEEGADVSNIQTAEDDGMQLFDFSVLEETHLLVQLDVGSSAYWSQITQAQNLWNMLINGFIILPEYLEQAPDDTVPDKSGLQESVEERMAMESAPPEPSYDSQIPPEMMAPPPPEMVPPPAPPAPPMAPEMMAPPPAPAPQQPIPPDLMAAILAQAQAAPPVM